MAPPNIALVYFVLPVQELSEADAGLKAFASSPIGQSKEFLKAISIVPSVLAGDEEEVCCDPC